MEEYINQLTNDELRQLIKLAEGRLRRCHHCGRSLAGKRRGTRYCSAEHRIAAHRFRSQDPVRR